MAGMEGLGRLNDVIPNISAAVKFKVRGASCIQVVVSGAAAVITLAQGSSFGGSFATAAAVIKNVYWKATPGDGTVAWNKLTYVNGTAPFGSGPLSTYTHGTTTGLTTAVTSVFHIFTSELSDPFNYIQATPTGSGVIQIFPVDLVSQRTPPNLELLSA